MIPWVREWHQKYAGDDFEVIGVHFPEFQYERDFQNVVDATRRLGIAYPVVQDNEGAIWRAYRQRYWPTRYLLDKSGRIRYKHIGEGAYKETEAAIQALIGEPDPVE